LNGDVRLTEQMAGRVAGACLGFKPQRAARVVTDPGGLVDHHHAGRPMGALGFTRPGLDHYLQHPGPAVVQQPMV
jgi:hypothetical protein